MDGNKLAASQLALAFYAWLLAVDLRPRVVPEVIGLGLTRRKCPNCGVIGIKDCQIFLYD